MAVAVVSCQINSPEFMPVYVCYDTMVTRFYVMATEREHTDEGISIDISYSTDVRVLAEEVSRTKGPKSITDGDREVARSVPVGSGRKPKRIDPEKLSSALERLGETMGDADPDELIADIYRAREEGGTKT